MNGRTDGRTYVQKAFYNLPTTAFGRRREIKRIFVSGLVYCSKLHLGEESLHFCQNKYALRKSIRAK